MKRVVKIDKLNKTTKTYESVAECSRQMKLPVHNYLLNKCGGHGRFIFMYETDYITQYPTGYKF